MEQENTIKTLIQPGKEFNLWMDIEKSVGETDGERIISGMASDESVDMDGQKVAASGIEKSLSYFRKFGKLDYDHKSKLGPQYLIGEPLEASVKGGKFYLKGKLYKGVKVADDVWDMLKAGAKMGFSVAGKILDIKPELDKALGVEVPKITKVLLTTVAITPHPVNFNTYCNWGELAKSISTDPNSKLTDEDIESELQKAISTADGSGKPLIGQSLEQKIHKETFGDDGGKEEKLQKLRDLKSKLQSIKTKKRRKAMSNIEKSISSLEKGIEDLEKAIERDDEEQPEVEETEEAGSKKPACKKAAPAPAPAPEAEEEEVEEEEAEEDAHAESAEGKGEEPGAQKQAGADGEPAPEENDDDEEDEEAEGTQMSKAFEVSPVLQFVGNELKQTKMLNKSLVKSQKVLLKSVVKQMELIKSLTERINALEDEPLLRKSVAKASEKRGAGEDQNQILSKSGSVEMSTILEKAVKGEIPRHLVVQAELGMIDQ